jgi:hypothetical protein
VLASVVGAVPATAVTERWMVESGDAVLYLDSAALDRLGISIDVARGGAGESSSSMISLTIRGGFPLDVEVQDGSLDAVWRGELGTDAEMVIQNPRSLIKIEGVSIRLLWVGDAAEMAIIDEAGSLRDPILELQGVKIGIDDTRKVLLWEAPEVIITPSLARAFGDPSFTGSSIGAMRGRALFATRELEPAEIGPGGDSEMTLPPAHQAIHPTIRGGTGGTSCWDPGEPLVGPDVIVGEMPGMGNYAAASGIEAYSVATTSCNIGSANLLWQDDTPNVPVIGQSMFRLKNGRFEQIGQGWLKYAFLALTGNACGCGCNGQGGSVLGVGCSDPYSASLNGQQSNLGPKYEVNAFTGSHPSFPADPTYSGSIARRIQVRIADLDPAQQGGGIYFVESQYVTPDDAAAGNHFNNASYRRINIALGTWDASVTGTTQREQPAIRAWKDTDPSVTETDILIPGEGLLILASKATDLGDGYIHYEYALQNLNSDRSAGSFSVPIVDEADVRNIGFHDVDYHSGEIFDGTNWVVTRGGGMITWATTPYATNPNANALRWGTLYNLRFEANSPPTTVNVTVGLFKPGTPPSVTASAQGPVFCLPEFCDDANLCTEDACGTSSCTHTAIDMACDDGDSCTVDDDCSTGTCAGTPVVILYADVYPPGGDDMVDVDDLMCGVLGHGGVAPCDELGDIDPCGGDGDVDVDDIGAIVYAYAGDYACPHPCPP